MSRPRSEGFHQKLTPRDTRIPMWARATTTITDPIGATYYAEGLYRKSYGTKGTCGEGWKIHISADPMDCMPVAAIALPWLIKAGYWHKFVPKPVDVQERLTGSQRGKFIAIYTLSIADVIEVLTQLDPLLTGKGFTGPHILGEEKIGHSGLLFTRFGAYQSDKLLAPDAKHWLLDMRGDSSHPPWVPDFKTSLSLTTWTFRVYANEGTRGFKRVNVGDPRNYPTLVNPSEYKDLEKL